MIRQPAVRFTDVDTRRAAETWGANCGPGAIAAILHLTLDELRPHLREFERKGYTNPSLMYAVLRDLGIPFSVRMFSHVGGGGDCQVWPDYGLARIQWDGPWTAAGVPMAARYRHTHWVAASGAEIFDVNAMSVGGWITAGVWQADLVPWLLRHCEPKANGRWWITHSIQIDLAAALSCRSRLESTACR